jgi:hypothetical protein
MRTRSLYAAGALAGLVLLAGCGSSPRERAATASPRLPRTLAGELARSSDAVAAALDSGDGCSALTAVRALQQQTDTAIAGHQVSARLRQPLKAAVDDLAGRIQCVPPVETNTQPQAGDQGHGKDRGKHKGKKKHEGGD